MTDETADRSSPFAPALVIGAVMVGFLAFMAWAGLGAFEPDFRNGDDGGAHALSKSAVGYSGLAVLLNGMGRPAMIARGAVAEGGPNAMMIVTIDEGSPPTGLKALPTTRSFAGPMLEILPKWETIPSLRKGWVRKIGLQKVEANRWLGPEDERLSPVREKDRDKTKPIVELAQQKGKAEHWLIYAAAPSVSIRIPTGEIEAFQTFKSSPGWQPILVDETGAVVLMTSDGGHTFALSEPDLLNNHGLADLTRASAGLFVLDQVSRQGPVYLDVTLNGFERARSLIKLMMQPPFLGATLCLLVAALLMLWHAVRRFGAAARGARELAMGKTVLADNQAGLIRMARRQHRMGAGYAAVVRGLVARAVAAPRDLGGEALEAFLDRLGRGRATDTLTDLTAAASRAGGNHELMDAALRLHRWRLEMTRDSR